MTRCFTLVNYDHLHRKETNSLFMVFCAIRYGPSNMFVGQVFTLVSIVLHRSLWWPWHQGFFGPIPRTSIESTRYRLGPGHGRNISVTPWWVKDSTNHYKMMYRKEIRLLVDTYILVPVAFLIILVGPTQWIKLRYLFFGKCCSSAICASPLSPECQHLLQKPGRRQW